MFALSADQGWFTISIEGGPSFGVYELKGQEKLNEPYQFELEVVSKQMGLELSGLLGRQALLTIADHSGGKRKVHASIRQAEQLHTANSFTHYRLWLVPRLWYLGRNQNHRIFQHKTTPEIIDTILKEQKFFSQHVEWQLKENYESREYCVQYAESDLYFITRLCEEEGIYFYHEHKDDAHILCFTDASGGPWIPQEVNGLLRFFSGSGQAAEGAVVSRLNLRQRINSDAAAYQEWNFEQPPLKLEVMADEPDQEKAPAPGGLRLETYQFPHLYNLRSPGERFVDLQLMRQLTFSKWVEGESDVPRLLPGFAFHLFDHPCESLNSKWYLTEVHHFGEQPQVLEHEAPDRGFFYQNRFTAIPFETRFVPAINFPKKRVEGLQSAIVTGPEGEEVYVDEYGRVKVHFHWDRLGPMTEKSTCWVRVADGWAGNNFGFIQAPRIGQEVIVEFMEGDPDRPVITGRVYNAEKMPPWELPSQKVLSGIQSREFKGGQRNQIVFDDTEGQVQTQVSSDHNLSQLNLGYLTRINHVSGRQDFRGEGFELRTDGWGAIRAAKGLFISTDARGQAGSYHKDLAEAWRQINTSSRQHNNQNDLAAKHDAQPDEPEEIKESLEAQVDAVKGDESEQSELSTPHIVMSSPEGLALATPKSSHIAAGQNLALTAKDNVAAVSGKSLIVSALRRISLFAYDAGMKIFAAKGKVEIQAQSDDLDLIADKVLKIISAKEYVHISAPKEILLTANGSYVKINGAGVESGTSGQFIAYAAQHNFVGPKTMPHLPMSFSNAIEELLEEKTWVEFQLFDYDNNPIPNEDYILTLPDNSTVQGRLDENGFMHADNIPRGRCQIRFPNLDSSANVRKI